MANVACIGAGFWGKNLIRTFYSLGALKACCDASSAALKWVASHYPTVNCVTEYQAVLADASIQAVVIATPAGTHFELAKAALAAGKHVYVEKPITLDVKHAQELIDLAAKHKRRLMVGHLLLYHAAVRRTKEMIKAGELGDLYYIYTQRVNLGTVRSDENAIWSLAPHDISIILYLFDDMPAEVSAVGQSYIQKGKGIEDVGFINLRFNSGRMANVHVSWLDPHKFRTIVVVGSKKMVVFDDMHPTEKVRVYDKGVDLEKAASYESYGESLTIRSGDIHIPKIDLNEPLMAECRHFLECVEKDKEPLSNGRNGLDVLKVLVAAEESIAKNGVPVKI